MDKRTLIAFVLATLVLVVWSFLFPSPPANHRLRPDSTVAVQSAESLKGTSASTTPASQATGAGEKPVAELEAPPSSGAEPAWEPAPVDTVRVETDFVEARILSRGGGLTGLILKDFPSGAQSGPVNLVRAGHDALDLAVRRGTVEISLNGAPCAVSRQQGIEGGSRFEEVVLTAHRSDGLTVVRKYKFRDGGYDVRHTVEVTGLPPGPPPILVVGWHSGIPYTEQTRQANEQFMAAILRVGDELVSWPPGRFKQGPRRLEGAVRWAAVSNKYFLAALVPASGTTATTAGADGDHSSFRNSVWVELPASTASGGRADLIVYIGPKDFKQLNALGVGLGDAVSLGYRWMRPLSQFMLKILIKTHSIIPNYGAVIIVLSVLVRLLLLPLNQASMKSMKAMQELAPHIEKLRKEYRDKPQEMQKRIMQLYQKHGVNPLGGCLPLVLQMPVLFSLYFVLMFAIELRMAPFVFWIKDLSAPDTVAVMGGFPIHVLPLIMTAVSVLQARSTPKDPQQAMITQITPIMFLVLFYSMPSGLVLYWTVTSLGTWAQQAWINRRGPRLTAVAAEETSVEEVKSADAVASTLGAGDGDGAGVAKPRAAGSPTPRRRR